MTVARGGFPQRSPLIITRYVTILAVIQSFASPKTEELWRRERVRGIGPEIQRQVVRKLLQLNIARQLSDLAVPPGNRLEKLRGDRAGQHSIRVNDQFRICFRWIDSGPAEVEFVDYH